MLTIKNYYKLCDKFLNGGWKVDFCNETPQHYEISVTSGTTFTKKLIKLNRERESHPITTDGAYYFYNNRDERVWSVTAPYIADMGNMLSSLSFLLKEV